MRTSRLVSQRRLSAIAQPRRGTNLASFPPRLLGSRALRLPS